VGDRPGIADPKRVCIYGGSYGGYAAMMGVARDPTCSSAR
jgi:dipeptidyl aminopeptidase/acylaminoacyl peptidase